MKIKLATFVIVALSFPQLIIADSVPSLDLYEIIEEAKLNNPEIQASKASYDAARSRISGIRHLKDPMIGVEFAGNMRMYSLTQYFPFPTKLSTFSEFASTEVEQYKHLYEEKTWEVVRRVKKTYAELFFVHKKIQAVKESVAFLKQLFHVASRKYSIGEASQAAVLRGQVALAKAEENLLTLTDEKKIAEARLNTLLNRPIDADLGIPQFLDTSMVKLKLDDLYKLAMENRAKLNAFRSILKKTELMVSIAREKYIPDLMFKFTQQEMGYNFTDRKYMFGFTLPLWFWGKQNEMVKEMNAHLKMVQTKYDAIENTVLLAVKEAKINVDKNHRTIELYKNSIVPQAMASLKSALVAYESNQIDFFNLLESETILVQFELDFYRAQADFFTSVADLEEAVGIELDNVEGKK